MIVPQFWAEARLQRRKLGRQITIKRFGWSDESQERAQAHADERAAEALQRAVTGEKLARVDRKIPYNGAQGLPIREEIVSRHGETIITRNSYGARCLNTPNVLFADVDFTVPRSSQLVAVAFLAAFILAVFVIQKSESKPHALLLIPAGLLIAAFLSHLATRRAKAHQAESAEERALSRIEKFAEDNPFWSLRVYRTPAGLRGLVTHKPFDPRDAEVTSFFKEIGTDPLYARMCTNQNCFRARLSPKPWRIGIDEHMRPRPGVWPISPERMPVRAAWIAGYETVAMSFAACQFLKTIGSGSIDPGIRSVVELHDSMSKALSGLPIA